MRISPISFLLLASNVDSAPRNGHPMPGVQELATKREMSPKLFDSMFKRPLTNEKLSAFAIRDDEACTPWKKHHGLCSDSDEDGPISDSDRGEGHDGHHDGHWWTDWLNESDDSCSDISDDEEPMPRCMKDGDGGWMTDPDKNLEGRDDDDNDDSYKLMLMEESKDGGAPGTWTLSEDNLHMGNCHSIHWNSMGFPKGGTPYIKYIGFQADPVTPDCTGDYYAVSDGSMVLLERSDQLRSWVVPTVHIP